MSIFAVHPTSGVVWHKPRPLFPPAPAGHAGAFVSGIAGRPSTPLTLVGTPAAAPLVCDALDRGLAVKTRPPGRSPEPPEVFRPADPSSPGAAADASHPAQARAWAVAAGRLPLAAHPTVKPLRFLGLSDDLGLLVVRQIGDPRWDKLADPDPFGELGPYHDAPAVRRCGLDGPWAKLWAGELHSLPGADDPRGVPARIAAKYGPAEAGRFAVKLVWSYWLAAVTHPELFRPERLLRPAELPAWRAA